MTSKQIERRFNVLKTAVAILLSLGFALLVIAFVSEDPVKAITAFIVGPFQKASRISNIVEVMTPLLFTGTAICIMYQANQFSMIGEGAFLIGANLATWFAITHDKWAGLPLIAVCFIVAIVSGVVVAVVELFIVKKYRDKILLIYDRTSESMLKVVSKHRSKEKKKIVHHKKRK